MNAQAKSAPTTGRPCSSKNNCTQAMFKAMFKLKLILILIAFIGVSGYGIEQPASMFPVELIEVHTLMTVGTYHRAS
jgi:hypothetical protein